MNAGIFVALLLAVLLQVNQPASGTFSEASESMRKYMQASSFYQPANHELMKELKIIRSILEQSHSSTFLSGAPGPFISGGPLIGVRSGINLNGGSISGTDNAKL